MEVDCAPALAVAEQTVDGDNIAVAIGIAKVL